MTGHKKPSCLLQLRKGSLEAVLHSWSPLQSSDLSVFRFSSLWNCNPLSVSVAIESTAAGEYFSSIWYFLVVSLRGWSSLCSGLAQSPIEHLFQLLGKLFCPDITTCWLGVRKVTYSSTITLSWSWLFPVAVFGRGASDFMDAVVTWAERPLLAGLLCIRNNVAATPPSPPRNNTVNLSSFSPPSFLLKSDNVSSSV